MSDWQGTPQQQTHFPRLIIFLLPGLLGLNGLLSFFLLAAGSTLHRDVYVILLLLNGLLFVTLMVLVCVRLFLQLRTASTIETRLRTIVRRFDRRTVQFQAAARIARDATAEPNLDAVLRSAVNLVHERFGFYHAGIFLLDDTRTYAILRAVAGGEASHTLVKKQHRLKVGQQGVIGFVTGSGMPHVVLDVSRDSYYYDNPALPETRSEMAVPLKVNGIIIGALDVQSVQIGAFDEDDVDIIQMMADLLAVAIHKADLHGQVQENATQLEQHVRERTLELASERARLRTILESMTEGVIYRENSRTIYVNAAFSRLMGYTIDEVDASLAAGKFPGVMGSDTQPLYQEVEEGLMRMGYWQREVHLRRKDGTEFEAAFTIQRVETAFEGDMSVVAIIRDISQERALQEQKTRFVAHASHELRTPLTNMKTRLYLLGKQPHRYEEHYQILQQVTARMQRLVDDLLDKSRFERGRISLELGTAVLQEVIQDVVMLQLPEAERKSIVFRTSLPDSPVRVWMDKDRMIQVLTNLVTNAINYTPETGKVTVSLRELSDNRAEICVEDTGVGIPEHLLNEVFQPFFRGDNITARGTGLGLNITRQIVELHGGEIAVESELDKGSRFYVRLNRIPVTVSTF